MFNKLCKIFCVFTFLAVFAISESFALAKGKDNPFDTNLVAKTPVSSIKGSYIPIGTKIKVALAENVRSQNAVKNQIVEIVTQEDINVDGVCVYPKGSLGTAKIYKAVPARSGWKTARLEIIGVELNRHGNFMMAAIPVGAIPITNGIQMVEDTKYAYDEEWKYEKPTLIKTKKGGTIYVQRGAFGQSLGMLIKSTAGLGEIGDLYDKTRRGLKKSKSDYFQFSDYFQLAYLKGADICYPKGTEFYVLVSDNVDLGYDVKALEASRIAAEAEEKRRMEENRLAEARRIAEQEERERIERSTEPVMPETTIK